jgi:hypothetical protein
MQVEMSLQYVIVFMTWSTKETVKLLVGHFLIVFYGHCLSFRVDTLCRAPVIRALLYNTTTLGVPTTTNVSLNGFGKGSPDHSNAVRLIL